MIKRELKIPINKAVQGADLCLENALQFCSDAKVLVEKSSYEHALGFCIFAIEELGKAILLKSKVAYAQVENEAFVFLKKEKPENLFQRTAEDLKEKGFQENKGTGLKEVYPFYHHLSKLLAASNTMFMGTHENVAKSLDGKAFESDDEIDKTIENLLKEAYEINVYHTDLRELVLYVDYDQKQEEWNKGRLKLTHEKVGNLVRNIESAIALNQQWKFKLSLNLTKTP